MTRLGLFLARAVLAGALAGALAPAAEAHHSLAAFDHTKQVVIDGVVKTFAFANPHSKLVVVEKQPDGSTKDWQIETGGPAVLFRYNVKADTFAVGDRVTVTVHPHRTDTTSAALMRVVKADGATFMLENAK